MPDATQKRREAAYNRAWYRCIQAAEHLQRSYGFTAVERAAHDLMLAAQSLERSASRLSTEPMSGQMTLGMA